MYCNELVWCRRIDLVLVKARLTFGDSDTNSTNRSRRSRILWKQSPDKRSFRELQVRPSDPGAFPLDLTLHEGGNLPRLKTAAGEALGNRNRWKYFAALTSYSAAVWLLLF